MIVDAERPFALVPVYSTPNVNQSILLYQEAVEIQIDSQKVAVGKGDIYLNWLPSPEIRIEINNLSLEISAQDFRDRAYRNRVQLLLSSSKNKVSADLNKFSYLPDTTADSSWRIDVVGRLDEVLWSKSDESLKYILGHLVNFPRLLGNWILYPQLEEESRARVVLTETDWKITIDNVNNISEINKELCRLGGYGITSTIKIERSSENDSTISSDDAKKIIEVLYFLLSFTVGRYSPIILPLGFDYSGLEIWYEWRNWLISQWENTKSWFSGEKNWDGLAEVFPGFMKVWDASDSIWREPIKRSILWYVESNRETVDPSGRIIWLQSALELLSWTYFVSTGRKTEQEFTYLGDTCKKIKAFLHELNIPTSFSKMPTGFQYFGSFIESHQQSWQDKEQKFQNSKRGKNGDKTNSPKVEKQSLENYLYLKAFVEVRNDIVHPKQRSKITFSSIKSSYEDLFWIRVEALKLGLWYLELSLLRLFEYQGSYVNRLERGALETVPWA